MPRTPGDYAIVDARNAPDYQAARIPNAINILIGDFLNTEFTMKTALEIDALLLSRGIDRDKIIYTHCYIGYRSSQEYFVFRLMGYTVAQYDGSWTEWAADPSTPKESQERPSIHVLPESTWPIESEVNAG